MSTTQMPTAGQRLARKLVEGIDREYDSNQSALERELNYRVSQSTISRMLEDPAPCKWESVGKVVRALGLDVAECEALHYEAREALVTSRENGSGCFRCAWAALGNYIAGVLAGTLEPRWGLA